MSYFDITGSPAHLRYLVQRLRQRMPRGTAILVGRWPAADSVLSDPAMQRSITADYFTSSLGQSVTSCVEAARKVEEAEKAAA